MGAVKVEVAVAVTKLPPRSGTLLELGAAVFLWSSDFKGDADGLLEASEVLAMQQRRRKRNLVMMMPMECWDVLHSHSDGPFDKAW